MEWVRLLSESVRHNAHLIAPDARGPLSRFRDFSFGVARRRRADPPLF
jgi:hypothetical protein